MSRTIPLTPRRIRGITYQEATMPRKDTRKRITIVVDIPNSLKTQIVAKAEECNTTPSSYVRSILQAYVDKKDSNSGNTQTETITTPFTATCPF
jgi:hypothetical protein